jgi:hypothetical protein
MNRDAIDAIHMLAARALNTAVDLSGRIGARPEFDQLIRQIGDTVSAAACASSGSATATRRRRAVAAAAPLSRRRNGRAAAPGGLRLIVGGLR